MRTRLYRFVDRVEQGKRSGKIFDNTTSGLIFISFINLLIKLLGLLAIIWRSFTRRLLHSHT